MAEAWPQEDIELEEEHPVAQQKKAGHTRSGQRQRKTQVERSTHQEGESGNESEDCEGLGALTHNEGESARTMGLLDKLAERAASNALQKAE